MQQLSQEIFFFYPKKLQQIIFDIRLKSTKHILRLALSMIESPKFLSKKTENCVETIRYMYAMSVPNWYSWERTNISLVAAGSLLLTI